jgi:hypothetical protein
MMSPDHITHPYPTEQEKAQIMAETGIELKQLTNWFVNNRKRFWKPRVEARLQKHAQVQAVRVATAPLVSPSKFDQPSKGAPYITLDMTQQPHRVSVTSYDDSDCFRVVNSEALSTFDRSGSPHAVSVGSDSVSAVSDSDNSASEMDDDFNTGDVVDEVDTESRTVETAGAVPGLPTAPETPQVPRKRSRIIEADEAEIHRPKYLRKCTNTWRDACRTASDGYDCDLPSLDEASHLFGYSEL